MFTQIQIQSQIPITIPIERVQRTVSIIRIQFNHNNEINIMKYNINTLNALPGKQLTALSHTIPFALSISMPNSELEYGAHEAPHAATQRHLAIKGFKVRNRYTKYIT